MATSTKGRHRQFFDPQARRFLPDRYVQARAPNCAYEKARGDQCDNCGRTLDPEDLNRSKSTHQRRDAGAR